MEICFTGVPKNKFVEINYPVFQNVIKFFEVSFLKVMPMGRIIMPNEIIREHYNKFTAEREKWLNRNRYYYKSKERFYQFLIPRSKRVLVIGCETGDLLASLKPSYGVGIDISEKMIDIARQKHKDYKFYTMDAQEKLPDEKFDYVVICGMVGELEDVQTFFNTLKTAGDEFTCYILDHYNALWEPLLKFGEAIKLRMPTPFQNWLQIDQISNLLDLCGFDILKTYRCFLFPFYIPVLSFFINSILINVPFLNRLSLLRYVVAKKVCTETHNYGISVVIPCRNEESNIKHVAERIPDMGRHVEIIFVDNGSTDHTADEIKKTIKDNPNRDIKLYVQPKIGKKNALIEGFDRAQQEVLMILDADLTVMPGDLEKFFNVINCGKAEFVNGSRMVYPQERQSMRYLNIIGNYIFGRIFSWVLKFSLTDTLCGTKGFLKKYWPEIKENEITSRGSLDKWGDFDLLFAAASFNLKMAEIPVRYKRRVYERSKMQHFRHGFKLLIMTFIAIKRFRINC
ncbi:MAG: glycosyltransferase [Candidatus Omnitrophica bacterium]|nr:glycosyltransferase [Candidatus Omnitrophota bacterium]